MSRRSLSCSGLEERALAARFSSRRLILGGACDGDDVLALRMVIFMPVEGTQTAARLEALGVASPV